MQKESIKFANSNLFEGMSSISALIHAIEAKRNDRKILRIFFEADKLQASTYKKQAKEAQLRFLQSKSKELGFDIEIVSKEEIDSLAIGTTHGGILAECTDRKLPILSMSDILPCGVYFVLDGVEDPYNFG